MTLSNHTVTLENGPLTLLKFLDGSGLIQLKYRYCIEVDPKGYETGSLLFECIEGSVTIKSASSRHRFYSNLTMEPTSIEAWDSSTPPTGKRITRIRNLIFIDSQLYVKTADNLVLKIKEENGFIALKISDKEYLSTINQIKNHGRDRN